ncbi:MAG TPA: hypothetical protein VJR48_17040 [Ktedonobacterales bacterium]|nr:hypothetical protein [Ktedonobacterales bacterium]
MPARTLHQGGDASSQVGVEPTVDRIRVARAVQSTLRDGVNAGPVGHLEQRCGLLAQVRTWLMIPQRHEFPPLLVAQQQRAAAHWLPPSGFRTSSALHHDGSVPLPD